MAGNINISKTIELLVEIQNVAEELFTLEQANNNKNNVLNKAKQNYDTAKDEYDQIKNNIDNANNTISSYKKEIDNYIEQINKIKSKEKLVTTQKGYLALDSELAFIRENIEKIEKDIKTQEYEIESMEKELEKNKQILDSLSEEYQKAKDDALKELNKNKEKIKKAHKFKESVAPEIDPYTLKRYEHIVMNKNGVGIVPVVGGHCDGCNIKITPQLMSKLIKHQEIVYCSNCARMLYLLGRKKSKKESLKI